MSTSTAALIRITLNNVKTFSRIIEAIDREVLWRTSFVSPRATRSLTSACVRPESVEECVITSFSVGEDFKSDGYVSPIWATCQSKVRAGFSFFRAWVSKGASFNAIERLFSNDVTTVTTMVTIMKDKDGRIPISGAQ